MQYFSTPGSVAIIAKLSWKGMEIPVPGSIELDVLPDRKYRAFVVLSDWTEIAVIALGAALAAATGISTQYDATFGSFGQYVALLSWAAGASAGANMFKELGTTSTLGGRGDVALATSTGAKV